MIYDRFLKPLQRYIYGGISILGAATTLHYTKTIVQEYWTPTDISKEAEVMVRDKNAEQLRAIRNEYEEKLTLEQQKILTGQIIDKHFENEAIKTRANIEKNIKVKFEN